MGKLINSNNDLDIDPSQNMSTYSLKNYKNQTYKYKVPIINWTDT